MTMSEKTNKKALLKTNLSGPLFMGLVLMSSSAYALPQNGSVAGGSATIGGDVNGTMDITQNTDRTIINWDSYDIAAGETVNYSQPTASSIALNRVTGSANASQIFGTINANGNVIIVNRHGVVFGAGSQVNVGGLVVSSSDMADDDFMAGGDLKFTQTGDSDASIINNGTITISEGGLAALVGPNVTNNGYIGARLGKIHLASGDIFTIDLYGDGLILLQASSEITEQLVKNSGTIQADGGQILMTAAAAEETVDSLINMDGVLEANTVGEKEGQIVLYAEGVTAVADNDAAVKNTADGASTVLVSGTIEAKGDDAGEKGGSVKILGDQIALLSDSSVDVSGMAGGGLIYVGGQYHGEGTTPTANYTIVQEGASLKANALEDGDGGEIVVWSDDATIFAGAIEAKGAGTGDGGFVETSGANTLSSYGSVDASSENGEEGTWLLDPGNITITDSTSGTAATGNPNFKSKNVTSYVKASDVEYSLNHGTNVTITTTNNCSGLACIATPFAAGNITVSANIEKTNGSAAKLTLNADGDIVISGGYKISSNSGTLSVDLNAGDDISMASGSSIISNGGKVTMDGDDISIAGATIKTGTGALTVKADGSLTISASLVRAGAISLNADDALSVKSGSSLSGKTLGLSADGNLTIASSSLSASGNISLTGVGSASILGASYGVSIVSSSVTVTGNGSFVINGTGGTPLLGVSLVDIQNYGVSVKDSTLKTEGTGALTITGIGGNGIAGYTVNNYGVKLDGSSVLATGTGALSITGTGGHTSSLFAAGNSGIVLTGGSKVAARSGSTTLTGRALAWSLFGDDVYGIYTTGTAAIGDAQTQGKITLITNNMDVDGTLSVRTAGNVTFKTYDADKGIGIAGASGNLQLTSSILDHVTADSISIGSTAMSGTLRAKAYNWSSDVNFLTGAGNIVINGMQNVGSHAFLGYANTGNITIGAGGSVASSMAGDAITIVVKNGDFKNNGGVTGLSAPNGRWLVYGSDLASINLGDASEDFRRYSCTYGGSCPSVPTTGNGALYSFTPYLDVAPDTASVTYGSSAVTYNYTLSGYLLNDEPVDVVSGSPTYSSTYTVGDGVNGTYSFSIDTLGTLSSEMGYGFHISSAITSGVLTVNPATLIVTGDDLHKTYGQNDPAYTYNYSGLYSGDAIGNVLIGSLTRDTSMANQHVGTYAITQGTLDLVSGNSNYTLQYVDGSLTIRAKGLLVKADYLGKTYGEADPALTYTVAGLQYADTASDVFSGVLVRSGNENVGAYSIERGTLLPNSDYYIQSYRGAVFTISPAVLTVTADDQTINFGEAIPELTYSYGNLASWDSISTVLSGDLATTATSLSDAGFYDITQGSLALVSSNYTLSFTPGTLEIQDTGDINQILQESLGGTVRNLGYNGVLLALSTLPRGALGQLAPAAGGQLMTAAQLANLAPAAGGQGATGTVLPLIECSDDAPCQLNQ